MPVSASALLETLRRTHQKLYLKSMRTYFNDEIKPPSDWGVLFQRVKSSQQTQKHDQ